MDQICAGYGDAELELLADFLRRTTDAGRAAAVDAVGAALLAVGAVAVGVAVAVLIPLTARR